MNPFSFSKAEDRLGVPLPLTSRDHGSEAPGSQTSGGSDPPHRHFALPLQEKAEEVYRLYQSSPLSSHPVVALSELSTLGAGSCPDERTFYLVLLQLQKEKRVTVLEQNGEKVQERIPSPFTPRDLVPCVLTSPPAPLPSSFSACGVRAAVICPCPFRS